MILFRILDYLQFDSTKNVLHLNSNYTTIYVAKCTINQGLYIKLKANMYVYNRSWISHGICLNVGIKNLDLEISFILVLPLIHFV